MAPILALHEVDDALNQLEKLIFRVRWHNNEEAEQTQAHICCVLERLLVGLEIFKENGQDSLEEGVGFSTKAVE